MDTGLAGDIPVFIIGNLAAETEDSVQLARMELHAPINQDPAITPFFDPAALLASLHLHGPDNNGKNFHPSNQRG